MHQDYLWAFAQTMKQVYLGAKLKGFISLEDFKNGIIINSARDHLYANSNIKITEWDFIYQNLNLEMQKQNVTRIAVGQV